MSADGSTKHSFDFSIPPSSLSLNYTVNAVFNTVAFLIAFYIIIKKSPKIFHGMKHAFLNFLIWSYLYDFQITVAYRPLPLFPATVLCGNLGLYGLAKWKLISTVVPVVICQI